jgi:hypothetical protein
LDFHLSACLSHCWLQRHTPEQGASIGAALLGSSQHEASAASATLEGLLEGGV